MCDTITGLTTQAQIAPTPYLQQSDTDARTCALQPDEATLQRLLRYESHAERSLARCLDQLARLRGVTVDRIHATITHEQPDGITTRFSAERSHQRPRPG